MGDNPLENEVDYSQSVAWGIIRRVASWVLFLVFLVALCWVLYRIRTIVVSVLVAGLLTYALLPGVEWLSKKRVWRLRPRVKRLLATIIVFGAFLGLVALAVTFFITPFGQELNDFLGSLADYAERVGKFIQTAGAWYTKAVPANVKDLLGKIDYTKLASSITDYAQRLLRVATSSVGLALEVVLIPVLAFYFLLDYRSLARELYGLVPPNRRRDAIRIGRIVGQVLQSYIFGQIILCVIAGVLTGIVLAALNMPYVVVLAIFAAVTRAIPIIGPVVSGVPIVLVGLLNSQGLALPLYLLGFVVVMHFAESKFIMPHLIGERLHLHPAMVIIVLLVGAEFFGIVGMFLAAPIAAVIRELIRFYYIKPRKVPEKRKAVKGTSPPLIKMGS